MADIKETGKRLAEKLSAAGADKYAISLSESEKRELNTENSEFSLYRTLFDQSAAVTALIGDKKGSASGNNLTEEGMDALVEAALASAQAAPGDSANDIAPCQGTEIFRSGPETADMDHFYERLEEALAAIKEEYPRILLTMAIGSHMKEHGLYLNSNGTQFETFSGLYDVMFEFAGNDGEKTTGINAGYAAMKDLTVPILDLGMIRKALEDAQNSLETVKTGGKFEGTVILTPDALGYFTQMLVHNFLTDGVILDGTSLWLDKIGQQVAGGQVTLRLQAQDDRLAVTDPVTADGYRAENVTLIEHGVLKSHILSLYAANKTGRPVTKNTGSSFVMEPGETMLEDMIRGVKRGLIVGGFSGGHPGANGEFSGVAKNSFYVEDGQIRGAVMETMINGNLADLFSKAYALSREQFSDGTGAFPYMATEGVIISG